MKNYIFLVGLTIVLSVGQSFSARELTLEKIWLKGTFSPKYVHGLRSMKDGIHYSVLEDINGQQKINVYDYEKGSLKNSLLVNNLKNDEGSELAIDDYQLSSDESKILIQTQSEKIYRHSVRSAYYVYDIPTKKLSRIGQDKFQLAEFSPDANYVSFVRDNNIFIYNLTNKTEKALSNDGLVNSIINGAPDWVYEEEFALVKAYEWSKDSKYVAYYRFDESNVKEFSFPVYGTLYPENYIYKYPKAGEENSKVSVLIYNLEKNSLVNVKVNFKYEYIPRIKWIPSNDLLSIQFMNREQNEILLEAIDRNTGTSFNLYREVSETYLEVQDAYFLSKSDGFLWLSEKSGYNQIYYVDYNSDMSNEGTAVIKDIQMINDGSNVVTEIIGVDEEKKLIYFTFTDKYNPTDRFTMVKPLGQEQMNPMMPFPTLPGFSKIEASNNFNFFIEYNNSYYQAPSVTVHNSEGFPIRTIEDNAALTDTLKNYQLSKKEFFKFPNGQGDELFGWVIKPPDFNPNKKYPVLLYVYGGPGSQTVTNTWGGSNDLWYQYLAKKGYIIASVDNRGTGARSRDFRTCTYLELGRIETEDQIFAAKYFAKMNYVDEKRIGIWGWSYGGYMSTLCLAKGADVFKMAIAVAPVTNWRFYDSIYTERYMGLPKSNGKSYDENSPINHVNKIKGKYLLVHGTSDDNVHFQNSVELVDALVKNNIQFDLAIYPNKNHSIYGGNTRYHLYTKMTSFIFENL